MKKVAARKGSKSPATAAPANTWMIHEKALKEFERGVGLLQKQSYSEALERFQTIVTGFPQEKELTDRAQAYTRICRNLLDQRDVGLEARAQHAINLGQFLGEQGFDEIAGHRVSR